MHRDLKPANIMINENNGFNLKLIDFGLAAYIDEDTHIFP